MKDVELRNRYAGPAGNWAPGVARMPDDIADGLIEAGVAKTLESKAAAPVEITRENLEGLTVPVLTSMAEEAGLNLGKRSKKAELVDALFDHAEAEAEAEEDSGDEGSDDDDPDPDLETAAVSEGENAAERTGQAEPRQRTRPAETDEKNEGESPTVPDQTE